MQVFIYRVRSISSVKFPHQERGLISQTNQGERSFYLSMYNVIVMINRPPAQLLSIASLQIKGKCDPCYIRVYDCGGVWTVMLYGTLGKK